MHDENEDFDDFMLFEAPMYFEEDEDEGGWHRPPETVKLGCMELAVICGIIFFVFFCMLLFLGY